MACQVIFSLVFLVAGKVKDGLRPSGRVPGFLGLLGGIADHFAVGRKPPSLLVFMFLLDRKGQFRMNKTLSLEDHDVLLSIQNTKNPAQGILLVIDESREHLETQGLRTLFGVKEIRLNTQEVLQDLQSMLRC